MGYLRRTSDYPKIIVLPNLTYMMSMVDCIDLGVETIRIDSGYSLEKKFIELIHMNP